MIFSIKLPNQIQATMKLFLILIVTVAADLIGYNRGVNNAFKHVRARGKLNTSSVDNRLQLVKYLLHLGRLQEARQLMQEVGKEQRNGQRTDRFKRYKRRQN